MSRCKNALESLLQLVYLETSCYLYEIAIIDFYVYVYVFVFDCHKAKWNNFNRDISIWKEKNKAKCCFHRVFASSINSFSSMYFVFFFTETFTFHFRMFLYMCRKFWIAKTFQFSQLLFIPLISLPPPSFHVPPSFHPLFRYHLLLYSETITVIRYCS